MGCVVIAVCSDCIVHSLHTAISAGERGGRRWSVCQLVGFPTCWEVGKLAGCGGEHSRDAGRRRKIAALQKKRRVGTPAATFPPKKGRRRKEVCPPKIDTHTETVRKRLTKKSNLPIHPPHGGGQYMSRKAPYRPESGSTKVSANASMKASRPCSAPRKGWPGYLNRKGSYQETYPVKTLCGRYHRPKPKRETGRTGFHYSPSPNESPAPPCLWLTATGQ